MSVCCFSKPSILIQLVVTYKGRVLAEGSLREWVSEGECVPVKRLGKYYSSHCGDEQTHTDTDKDMTHSIISKLQTATTCCYCVRSKVQIIQVSTWRHWHKREEKDKKTISQWHKKIKTSSPSASSPLPPPLGNPQQQEDKEETENCKKLSFFCLCVLSSHKFNWAQIGLLAGSNWWTLK